MQAQVSISGAGHRAGVRNVHGTHGSHARHGFEHAAFSTRMREESTGRSTSLFVHGFDTRLQNKEAQLSAIDERPGIPVWATESWSSIKPPMTIVALASGNQNVRRKLLRVRSGECRWQSSAYGAFLGQDFHANLRRRYDGMGPEREQRFHASRNQPFGAVFVKVGDRVAVAQAADRAESRATCPEQARVDLPDHELCSGFRVLVRNPRCYG